MRIAVMDLGTNTFHLLIVDKLTHGVHTVYRTKVAVKLGENGISSGFISEKPFQRGVRAMKRFKSKMDFYKPDTLVAVGTAALRNASNKKEFLLAVKNETGVEVRVITGPKEADLIYYGVKQAMPLGKEKTLIVDIGGGSVEFIIANDKKIFWKKSFPAGAAVLLDRFKPYDPISLQQVNAIRTCLNKMLKPLFEACKVHHPVSLTGSSGSFETFFDMITKRSNRHPQRRNVASYKFSMPDYCGLHRDLLFSTTGERQQMKGLLAMRVDMIVIASILLTFVIEKLRIQQMNLSTYALKEGVLWKVLQNKSI